MKDDSMLKRIATVLKKGEEMPDVAPFDFHSAPLGEEDDGVMTNQYGGKQSRIEGDLTLIPPQALIEVSKVLESGATKYGEGNWLKLTTREHLQHALLHIYQEIEGDPGAEDHLIHAICRLFFAWTTKNFVGGEENWSGHQFPAMPSLRSKG